MRAPAGGPHPVVGFRDGRQGELPGRDPSRDAASRGGSGPGVRALLRALSAGLLVVALAITPPVGAAARPTEAQVKASLESLAVPFIANDGQVDERVRYYAKTFAGTVFVTGEGQLVYSLPGAQDEGDRRERAGRDRSKSRGPGWTLVESFADGAPRAHAGAPAETNVSSFIGDDPRQWRSRLDTFRAVDLGQVWPGVEVELLARGNNVEKVYTVEPGHDPGRIGMEIHGALGLRIAGDGGLVAVTRPGEVTFRAPSAYQDLEGGRVEVEVAYRLSGSGYGFTLGSYDPDYRLVIDPLLQATYLAGSGADAAFALSVTGSEVFVAGRTDSTTFPGTAGGAQASSGGGQDAFVARLNLDLTALSQTTYLGGSGTDSAGVLSVTGSEVFVAGETTSANFPGTAGGPRRALAAATMMPLSRGSLSA